MPQMTTHPSQEQLSDYNLGRLPPAEASTIESHINHCEPCCDTMIALSADDTFVGLLQDARQLSTDPSFDQGTVSCLATSQQLPAPLAEHPRYEVLGLIGKGGMGDVYKARHRKMERTVALKVINRGLFRNAEAIDRFHREVKAAAQLAHPNIVTAYDADQADEFHFLVMEYVDGVDLARTIKDQGALSVAQACDYIRQAAIGLQHAHQCGMVHRDIKPHNLMVSKEGAVKILDFGLASLAPESPLERDTVEAGGGLTAFGSILGTPDFISPEQAADARHADIRSDIYSLGATLYFLLSGRSPFSDGSVTQKLNWHSFAEPERLDAVRSDVPSEVSAIVSKMTAKEPGERFQTPAEVAEALDCLVKQTQPEDAPQPVLLVRSSRRGTRWVGLTAIATIFLATLFSGIVYYIQTNNGTVRVEVADDSLAVEISGQTVTMNDGDHRPIQIQVGQKKLRIVQADSGFEFETDNFEIRRNDQIAFKVDLIQGEVVVSKDGKRFDRRQTESWPLLIEADEAKEPWQQNNRSLARFLHDKGLYVVGTGEVIPLAPPDQQQRVNSPVAGTVLRISESLVAGATVKQDDFLMEIERNAADLIAQWQVKAEALENERVSEKLTAQLYGENIIALEAANVAVLAMADASIDAAKAKWGEQERRLAEHETKALQARMALERQEALLKSGLGTKEQIEKSQKEWELVHAELEATKSDEQAAMREWETKKIERTEKDRAGLAKITIAKTTQRSALRQVEILEREIHDIDIKLSQVDRLRVKAPCDGMLIRLNVFEAGQMLKEGQELFTIGSNTFDRAVELRISGEDVSRVQPSDKVRLVFEGWPAAEPSDAFGGVVIGIDPAADGGGTFLLVKEDVDNPWPDPRFLRPGVRVNGWVLTGAQIPVDQSAAQPHSR